MILMLASHVIRYIKSRRIATRISYDLPVICFQKIHKQSNMFLTSPLSRYMKNQLQWVSRTVMVKENNVDEAMKVLNGIMAREGMLKRWRGTRYYEKPTRARQRVNYEKCTAIYNEDMSNKVRFLMRKNRAEPYPGC